MFDLEKAIHAWRKKTQSAGRLEDGDIEELESHLRELIAAKRNAGVNEEQSFLAAVKEVGHVRELGPQYRMARERESVQRARRFLPGLFVNYLIVMIRQFRRHRMHSWLTVIGLSVGLASCLFIALYVLHELSFDKTYEGTHIYRVINKSLTDQGTEDADAGGPVPMGPVLAEEFPEVKSAVRFWRAYRPVITFGDKKFEEQEFVFTDSHVFDVFKFPLVSGNSKDILKLTNTVVLSESMAKRYFGNEDAVGKTLEYNGYPQGRLSFTVTGVFADLPVNTHFSFDFLASIQTVRNEVDNWGSFKALWTYVALDNDEAAVQLQPKLETFADKYMEDRRNNRREFGLRLEPIASIYLESKAARPMKPGGDMALIRVAVFTGALILIMSCVNFVNISLARISVRMKEVGMRKVLGAVRLQLTFQFLSEVMVTFTISLLIAVALMFLLTPAFAGITGVVVTLASIMQWQLLAIVAGIFIFVVVVAGYTPAMTLSGFSVINAFRQKTSMSSSGRLLSFRNSLIFLQLAISGALIMAVMVVNEQLNYIANKDLGLKIDHVVAIPYSDNPEAFDNKLRAMPEVEAFGYSQRLPVNTLNYDGRVVQVPGIEKEIQVESCFITPGFLSTYNIRLLTGRNLLPNHLADSNKFVINATAVKTFGWDLATAVGRELTWSESIKGEVIGVVEDFHLESVHQTIPPMVMLNGERQSLRFYRTFISIRLDAANAIAAEQAIEKEWREMNPERVFMLVRMNESFDQLHTGDNVFSRISSYFMIIAVFISAIGLYAVSSYSAEQKRKEIGIRKVLGSSTGNIVFKLTAPYIIITIATFVVAVPVVYMAMNEWLSTFAYHVPVSWITIGSAGVLVLFLTILSVLKESVRAAVVNPIRFLREE